MIERYGKPVADIKKFKQSFFEDNEELVREHNKCAELYKKQPIRTVCKNCKASLDDGVPYESHGLRYVICARCGHVQGTHEETVAYSEYLYSESDYGKYIYGSGAEQEKYDLRAKNIYEPKVRFLLDAIKYGGGVNKDDIDLFDIGAGSGYFLSACDDLGIKAEGVDMSEVQVAYGNQFMHQKNGTTLSCIRGTDLEQTIREKKGINVISAIGLLEHVVDYHSILSAIRENRTVQYLYISVPMFGLSNVLETLLPDVYNRHLGGAHTHVFSESSLRFLCEKYDMEMIAKWQFGTDMMDLYRMCLVKNNARFGEIVHEKLYPCLDEMQLVLDKNGFSSEIHAVFKIHREKEN